MVSALARRILPVFLLAVIFTSPALLRGTQAGRGEITIDFLALANDGRPILDLKADEVTLRVGGRQRQIKNLKLVRSGDGGGAKAAAASAPAPYSTNTGGDGTGRTFLLIVDTEAMRASTERPVREAIDKLISTLSPADKIGIVVAPRTTLNVQPTTNHASVRAAVAQLKAREARATQENDICRTRDLLDNLRSILAALNPAESTNAVVMSARLYATGNEGACEVTTSEYQRVQSVAASARARLYVVLAQETVSSRNEGLETLAGVNNAGQVMQLAVGDNPLARVITETGAYYAATFDAEANERTGQMARVELRTSRSGVTLRGPSDIPLAKAEPAATGTVTPKQMLSTTTAFAALPLRAAGFPTRGQGGRLNIITMLEPVDGSTKLTAVSAALFDPANPSKPAVFSTTVDEKQLSGGTVLFGVDAAPGTYRLRVAATDGQGRSGAVDVPIDAALTTAGPLSFGALILGAVGDKGCTPRLQFASNVTDICAFIDMYGKPTAQMGGAVEIAATIDGPALVKQGVGVGASDAATDRFTLVAAPISIASLEPGDYIARAVISMQGQPDAKIVRTLRKVK